jgi:NAD(P)-dependent dehydrogenase (short-subunit alcohol dehydrogenase family)
LVHEAEADLGHLNILVNNAAVHRGKGLLDHTVEDWDHVIGVNLRGVFLCMRAVLPGMLRERSGSIVNISSVSALATSTPQAAYASSKAAVIALTRDAAVEFAPHGVRINSVAPGPTVTPMTAAMNRDAVTRLIPMRRWAEPEEIAAAVAFLVSDEARFITGITLPVAGGSDSQLAYGTAQREP